MRTPTVHTPSELQNWPNGESYEGGYRPARCMSFELSILHPRRWKIAWRVFTGRYDALDWESIEPGSPSVLDLKR
jgi:hypothetical protein